MESCVYCGGKFPRNGSLKITPFGRTVVFDARASHLWIVCERCGEWTLVPQEERARALLECERIVASTAEKEVVAGIGRATLGRLQLTSLSPQASNLIGDWRHRRRFDLKRKRNQLIGLAFSVACVGIPTALALLVSPAASIVGLAVILTPYWARVIARRLHAFYEYTGNDGSRHRVHVREMAQASIGLDASGSLVVSFPPSHAEDAAITLTGNPARELLGAVLPQKVPIVTPSQLTRALEILEPFAVASADPLVALLDIWRRSSLQQNNDAGGKVRLDSLSVEQKIALEIATFESMRRDPIAREMDPLHDAWKDAAEVATIADSLLPPADDGQ